MTMTMQVPQPHDVVSFDQDHFDGACGDLMDTVLENGRPDALIGIRTGGLYVAEAMARSDGSRLPVLSLTCRRPSSAYKNGVSGLKTLVTSLPRPVVDRLRVWEHAMLTSRPRSAPPPGHHFDPDELAELDGWLGSSGRTPSLVVVDDAVDSGATLFRVLEAVLQRAPPAAYICSAVITVTTSRPIISPDFSLYHGQLCRFPWSLDA
jgi:hypoxanthine phosphoribosyltransferase